MSHTVDYAFVHGGGQGSWVWNDAIAALHQQGGGTFARTLALDVPGCGQKRHRDLAKVTMDDIVAELLSDLMTARMHDVVLVGHSQAGTVLPRLAGKQPELFRRLVYVSCCAPLPGQTIPQMMGSGPRGSNREEVGWPSDLKPHDARERYPLMFCNDMDQSEKSDFLGKLGRDSWPQSTYAASDWRYDHLGSVPASYVVCLRDEALPVSWQETFAARVRAQRLTRIDAGHQVMITRPQALAEVLRKEASQ